MQISNGLWIWSEYSFIKIGAYKKKTLDSAFVLFTGSILCDCKLRTCKNHKKQCDINGLSVLMIHINKKKKEKMSVVFEQIKNYLEIY